MSEKLVIGKELKVKYSGIFDLNDMYRKMKFWLEWHNYGPEKGMEKMYIERIKPNGKQVEIKWVATDEASSYVNKVIEVTFFVIGLESIELEKEGKKIKTKKGDIEMRFTAYLVLNVDDKLGEDLSMTNKIYKRFVLKKNIDSYKIDLYDDLIEFQDEVKGFLTMQQF
ncbi:hypothetical protein J4427_00625 [Candidatus Woesearchaeota archaeon]|nr:hypothetical protein [Candidatus Woesearchaeota archaeon]